MEAAAASRSPDTRAAIWGSTFSPRISWSKQAFATTTLVGQVIRGLVLGLEGVCSRQPGRCNLVFEEMLARNEPENVEIRAYKRYDGRYQEFKGTETFARIERQPITIPRNR